MSLSWKIGTVFKIPVRLHVSMLLLPFITYNWLPISGIVDVIVWLGLNILLFGSVLLHELGHSLAARRYGIHTKDIILTPIGGMARITSMPKTAKQEIVIAIAGPLVSLGIAALMFLVTIPASIFPIVPQIVWETLVRLFQINLMLGLFNLLIPALPMDGGRVLRGMLALKYDFLKATQVAVRVSRVLAMMGGLAAIFWLESWASWNLALISGFIYLAAGNEVRMAKWRAYQEKMAAGGSGPFDGQGRGPFGAVPNPFGGVQQGSQGPGVRTYRWTWSTRNPPGDETYDRSGQIDSNRHRPEPDNYHPHSNEGWTSPSSGKNRDVINVNGKVEVLSRKNPDDEEQ
ncbi:MAG: site-2 protease family protein [Deltaproteobacteria bacterium]|nr:site-2 protease family protein [Deltaproteobacteria bacterium]